MYKCNCNKKLSKEDQYREVVRCLGHSKNINNDTVNIIIYSKIQDKTQISLNTVRYDLDYGINYICICGLYRGKIRVDLKIVAHYFSKIEEIESRYKDRQFFILSSFNHRIDCKNRSIPKLLELSYFGLIVKGETENSIEKAVNEGEIPREIFDQRLKWHNHLGLFKFKDIFHIYLPLTSNGLRGCKFPIEHLKVEHN